MRHTFYLLTAGILSLGLQTFACADDMPGMNMQHHVNAPADKAFAETMTTMMQNMNVTPTGNVDVDFAQMMIPHHQGAIDMAKVELQYGKDPVLLKLAKDVIAAQEKEIAEMKAVLAKNGK